MLYYMEVGGVFMWPIFFLAIISLAVVLEKLSYYVFVARDLNSKFKFDLSNLIVAANSQNIINYSKKFKNPLSKSALKIISKFNENKISDKNEFEYLVKTTINDEISRFEKGSWILGVCVGSAPQLGLLGTIVGMIKSFGALSSSGDPTMVASGISEALYTTAFGLLVAIPVLIIHVAINAKNDKLIQELDRLEILLLEKFGSLK